MVLCTCRLDRGPTGRWALPCGLASPPQVLWVCPLPPGCPMTPGRFSQRGAQGPGCPWKMGAQGCLALVRLELGQLWWPLVGSAQACGEQRPQLLQRVQSCL